MPVLPDYATVWRAQLVYDRALPVSACYLLRDPDFRPVQKVLLALEDRREDLIECWFIAGGATVLYRDPVQDMILPTDYEIHGECTIMGSAVMTVTGRAAQGGYLRYRCVPALDAGSGTTGCRTDGV